MKGIKMAHIWQGIIEEYKDLFPSTITDSIITLKEGNTPLISAPSLGKTLGGMEVYIKFEGTNPTGSFKDRGMTSAISAAAGKGVKAVMCASTGNTSASAAAYAKRAGMKCGVLIPDGKIAYGKLSQAIAHGATVMAVKGNFDDCLETVFELTDEYPIELVNSVNPNRILGQRSGAFEVVDELGEAPEIHCLPVGNAGNITAYWQGYRDYKDAGISQNLPRMFGFQAAGAAPIVNGARVLNPETIATAIRIGNPASWAQAEAARDDSNGLIDSVTDAEILAAHKILSSEIGVFVEPASAAGVAGLLKLGATGLAKLGVKPGSRIVITSTGHGLKDPLWALRSEPSEDSPQVEAIKVENNKDQILEILGL
ncbi:MAG: threonine synthase [Bifidobacteriaceae bacterium]|jgi:threonine synthase|nr:threonine synthase [Bifidobacteriaceae bacterium]